VNFIEQGCLFVVLVGYYLRGHIDLILRIKYAFFFTYRALKVAGNYRPGRRKMGFALRLGGAIPSGFYRK
jgi:hypothetical protein